MTVTEKQHAYTASIIWTGNKGTGTSAYTAYERDHIIEVAGKPDIPGSSDPSFRGNKARYNPEETFVAAVSACHMLWYLHLCSVNQVVVEAYVDHASGTLTENSDGSGQFSEVVLHPVVTVKEKKMVDKALSLHRDANQMCFISRSVKFPVRHEPQILVQ